MTAEVPSRVEATPPARPPAARAVVGVLGVAALAVGIVLLLSPMAAARTLALVVGLAFVLTGVLEIAVGWALGWRAVSVVLGLLLIAGGVLAAVWPHVTLWTLAVLTGLSLIAHGLGRIALAVVERGAGGERGWSAAVGVLNVLIGVLAIAWPKATVLVLCLVLGIQVALFGVLLLVAFVRLGRPAPPLPT